MITLELGLFLAVIAVGVVAFLWGRSAGKADGYSAGYVAGNNDAIDKLHPAAAGSVRVIRPER